MNCPQCGAPLAPNASKCQYCGEVLAQPETTVNQQPQYQQPYPYYQQPQPQVIVQQQVIDNRPVKSKVVAGLLALFLGGLGIHYFYLNRSGAGVMCILFCWTFIPAFIAFFSGIIILCSSDSEFERKWGCKAG